MSMAEKQDIAMNQFQIVTDAPYVYVELADGSQGKIKKSDLVEVIRAAMPIATHSSKGIMSADQAFYLRETTIIGGVAGGFPNRYKLIGILNYDAYAPFCVNISMGGYASTDRYLIDATLTYYNSAMYVSGVCYNRIGYVIKGNKAYVYLKEYAGNSYIGYVIGSERHEFTSYESEPSNIVYVP